MFILPGKLQKVLRLHTPAKTRTRSVVRSIIIPKKAAPTSLNFGKNVHN